MLKKFLADNAINYLENESLKNHTTFKVGGKADVLAMPDEEKQLSELIKYLKNENIKYYILGKGSNVIFNDEGFKGVIVKTCGIAKIEINENIIKASLGVPLASLCKTALDKGLSGIEFCYGIPGNVGGAVYMNAGAYGGEISDSIIEIGYLDEQLTKQTISSKNAKFDYRHSIFQEKGWIITDVTFNLKVEDKIKMKDFMEEILRKRTDKQPLDKPSAGSSFKRPQGYFAAALIEECGLKGMSVGGAQVSEKHAGFIINKGNATCKDILQLADNVEKIVYEKTGVKLEKEMIIV